MPTCRHQLAIPNSPSHRLVHLPDKLVDVRLSVAKVTTLHIVLEFACPPSAGWVGKFERPQKVRCL